MRNRPLKSAIASGAPSSPSNEISGAGCGAAAGINSPGLMSGSAAGSAAAPIVEASRTSAAAMMRDLAIAGITKAGGAA